MEQMREEGAKLLCTRLSGCSGFCHAQRCTDAIEEYGEAMDAALSLMQPEIDRRVAEEKARLLKRFDEDELEQIISDSLDMDWRPRDAARAIRQAMLAQFEKEQQP